MKPTPNRIVTYVESGIELERTGGQGTNGTREHPAIITRVWNDTCVNLIVFFDGTGSSVRKSVPFTSNLPYDNPYRAASYWKWPMTERAKATAFHADNIVNTAPSEPVGAGHADPTETP